MLDCPIVQGHNIRFQKTFLVRAKSRFPTMVQERDGDLRGYPLQREFMSSVR